MKIVLIEKGVAPYGAKCLICGLIAKGGQFVLYKNIPNVQHLILHPKCMEKKLEEIPEAIDKSVPDMYDAIRQGLLEGAGIA